MSHRIKISAGPVTVEAVLNDTPTAQAVWEALPFDARASLWGEEIYFETPISLDLDSSAREVVEAGSLGYWPQGRAMCIFFGPTPISAPGEIRPASAVNIFGRLEQGIELLGRVANGDQVRVDRCG